MAIVSKPTSIQCEGEVAPTNVSDTLPEFRAYVVFATETGVTDVTKIRVQISETADFGTDLIWDSETIVLDTPITTESWTEDITYGQSQEIKRMVDTNSIPPDTLYVNNTDAQSGVSNPTNLTDTTPVMSARVYPDNATLNKVQVQVSTDTNFATVTEWDSGWIDLGTNEITTSDVDTEGGARTIDVEYGSG